MNFLQTWGEAAYTTIGFFWMALWAFVLGYFISSLIQVFVTQKRMKEAMGKSGWREISLGAFFGFISSSCSFAALATAKSLFKKGAGFIPSIAFLLASTNLVIELGIVIAVFLSWQYVVGEYVGGILLILIAWLFVQLTNPKQLIKKARDRLSSKDSDSGIEPEPWRERVQKFDAWKKVGKKYRSEWRMVWKDVTFGFTIAGIVAVFVPPSFFETLFIGTGAGGDFTFWQILEHVIIGPVAAFMTFIGSMGNIPLAAVLFGNGVSFAGVMAFIFSDLVVFPVLRINAKYYGWKMSLYIVLTLFIALIGTSLALHYGFDLLSILPERGQGSNVLERDFFNIDYTLFFNIAFLILSAILVWFSTKKIQDQKLQGMSEMAAKGWVENVLTVLAIASYIWLAVGLILKFFIL